MQKVDVVSVARQPRLRLNLVAREHLERLTGVTAVTPAPAPLGDMVAQGR